MHKLFKIMKKKLNLDDFKLDDVKLINPEHVNGGTPSWTYSECTSGDDGCCDDTSDIDDDTDGNISNF